MHPKLHHLTAASLTLWTVGLTTASADQKCGYGQYIPLGKYLLLNNMWNQPQSPNGWQCVMNLNNSSPYSFQFDYNWPGNGLPYDVKAYPAIISGWQFGLWSDNSGLPTRVWDNKNLWTSGTTTITNPGTQNAAYDLWFHTINDPGNSAEPSDELMVWTSNWGGNAPLGTFQNDVYLVGTTWKVYRGNVGARGVYTFVRASNTNSWNFNLRDFIHYVVYTKYWISNSKFVTSVQYGTEPFATNGHGKLVVTNYKMDVQ